MKPITVKIQMSLTPIQSLTLPEGYYAWLEHMPNNKIQVGRHPLTVIVRHEPTNEERREDTRGSYVKVIYRLISEMQENESR